MHVTIKKLLIMHALGITALNDLALLLIKYYVLCESDAHTAAAVFSGTLNLTQSINQSTCQCLSACK